MYQLKKEKQPDIRRSQTEVIYHQLRDDLLSCRVRPGQKLIISDLTQQMQASLGAVREALSRLTSEGLVIAESQRGFRCAPVSLDDLHDLTETRVNIEVHCLTSAIRNGDIDWEVGVVSAYHQMVRLSEYVPGKNGEINEDWARAHAMFHEALVSACSNKWYLRIRGMLYFQSERYRRLSIPLRNSSEELRSSHSEAQVKDHKELLDAALSRNAKLAKSVMVDHLKRTEALLVAFSKKGGRSIFDDTH